MPTPDGPQFTLFHGTSTELKKNGLIKPQKGSLNRPDHKVAYASPHIAEAEAHAASRAQHGGMLFAPVYEVEHKDTDESNKYFTGRATPPKNPPVFGYDHAVSFKGFRTKRIAKWAINPDITSPVPKKLSKKEVDTSDDDEWNADITSSNFPPGYTQE